MCEECDRLKGEVNDVRGERDSAEYALIAAEDELLEALGELKEHQESCGAIEPDDWAYHQAATAAGQMELIGDYKLRAL